MINHDKLLYQKKEYKIIKTKNNGKNKNKKFN